MFAGIGGQEEHLPPLLGGTLVHAKRGQRKHPDKQDGHVLTQIMPRSSIGNSKGVTMVCIQKLWHPELVAALVRKNKQMGTAHMSGEV